MGLDATTGRRSRRTLLIGVGAGAVVLAGVGIGLGFVLPRSGAAISPSVRQALEAALDDEYKARATYNAVIEKLGPVAPFNNVVRAEDGHVRSLVTLFEQYGLPVPPDRYAGKVQAPATLAAACALGVQAELDNVAIYDRLLGTVQGKDEIVAVFQRLRAASQDNHLPAFKGCAGGG